MLSILINFQENSNKPFLPLILDTERKAPGAWIRDFLGMQFEQHIPRQESSLIVGCPLYPLYTPSRNLYELG